MDKGPIEFSVIICSHNRSAFLEDVVASLMAQDYPTSQFEVIIVDNGSTDNTIEIVHRMQQVFPSLAYTYEPRIGLSNARNKGAQCARGEIVVYIDDDAIAEESWLAPISTIFKEHGKQIWCVGGKIDIWWENGDRPDWLPDELEGYFGSTAALGSEIGQLHSPRHPNGSNLAVRRDRLLEVGGFSSQLGRIGGSLLSNEEAGLCQTLREHGGEIWYTPQAVVHHRVQVPLVTRRRLLKRAFWQGVSDVKVDQLQSPQVELSLSWNHLGIELWAFVRECVGLVGNVNVRNNKLVFARIFFLTSRLGRISQRFRGIT